MKRKLFLSLLLIFYNLSFIEYIRSDYNDFDKNYLENQFPIQFSLSKNIYEFKINKTNINNFIKVLKRYDYQNAPKKLIINGKITYTYKKSVDEPKKSIKEIEKLIRYPKKTEKYERFIRKAFLYLLSNNIKIYLKDIEKNDLSGQWIYKDKNILINKKVLKEGTVNFAYLLSHEMIHVTQSCKGGSFSSYPVLIGLKIKEPKSFYAHNLKSSIYEDLNDEEIKLEIEAYANQKNISQTLNIFKYFCLKN